MRGGKLNTLRIFCISNVDVNFSIHVYIMFLPYGCYLCFVKNNRIFDVECYKYIILQKHGRNT